MRGYKQKESKNEAGRKICINSVMAVTRTTHEFIFYLIDINV